MSYVGKKVSHSEFGVGEIIIDNGKRIYAEFPNNEKYAGNKYCFDVPEAFQLGYLELLEADNLDQYGPENINDSVSNKYRDLYKKQFLDYLNEDKVQRTGSPYKQDTVAVDAFFLEKHSRKRDFLDWMKSDEAMDEAKKEIALVIANPTDSTAKQRVQAYIIALSKLREFLIKKGVL